MFSKKEWVFLAIASLTIGYILSFNQTEVFWKVWMSMSGLALLMLFVHHIGQKLSALFYDCSTEMQLWSVRQYGFKGSANWAFPFPTWLAFPVLIIILTFGKLKWLAVTTFDAVPLQSRIRRRFAELTEWHLALISLGGIVASFILALVSHLLGYNSFAMLNLYFALFNLIPFSTLDGSKIFFGSVMLWLFTVVFNVTLLLLLGNVSFVTTIIAAFIVGVSAIVYYYYTIYS